MYKIGAFVLEINKKLDDDDNVYSRLVVIIVGIYPVKTKAKARVGSLDHLTVKIDSWSWS